MPYTLSPEDSETQLTRQEAAIMGSLPMPCGVLKLVLNARINAAGAVVAFELTPAQVSNAKELARVLKPALRDLAKRVAKMSTKPASLIETPSAASRIIQP